jgi:2-polyprenyl-3-methyl-5-hydroxy-6-metoxy-1,4-benzoquinol methylase
MKNTKPEEIRRANLASKAAWNENADYWDERMGEGNNFVNWLIWPAVERLLRIQKGELILDVACGNGLTSRRIAEMGAEVVAFDFAENMIQHAKDRTGDLSDRITYHVIDATDGAALQTLGEMQFDGALCNMALFDMAEVQPLIEALKGLLKPEGRFVFSITHPAFNGSEFVRLTETSEQQGRVVIRHAIKVYAYKTFSITEGIAMRDQPAVQPYFHRSLEELFAICFEGGFVLDGLEEPTFPLDEDIRSSWFEWGVELPPVLVARFRLLP